ILWLGALSRVPVSIAYPMLSVGYVVNALAAASLFSEALTAGKILGIALIIGGVVLLARTAP
ncbi:MAG TPA: transporter, partial [Steroidobacteraceae bacterium]